MKTKIRRLYLFRHGETDWNKEQRFQGHSNIPLNDTGREQVRKLIRPLTHLKIEAILSSDLDRANETAEILASAIRIPVFQDARLREAHLGGAQGLTALEIEKKFPGVIHRWKSSLPTDADVGYPGGETGAAVMNRAIAALQDFLSTPKHSAYTRIGISTHGGVIRRIIQFVRESEKGFLSAQAQEEHVPLANGIVYGIQISENTRTFEFLNSLEFPASNSVTGLNVLR